MNKLLLCTAMTMAFVNFANADFCPSKETFREAMNAHKNQIQEARAKKIKNIEISFNSGSESWKTNSFLFSSVPEAEFPLDDILTFEFTLKKIDHFCWATFKAPTTKRSPLLISITKEK